MGFIDATEKCVLFILCLKMIIPKDHFCLHILLRKGKYTVFVHLNCNFENH
jgi:hypothetical protein